MTNNSNGNQEMAQRAELVRNADKMLISAVERMGARYRLGRPAADIVSDIKRAIHAAIPPHNFSVFEMLSDHEREKAFNADAARTFRTVHSAFEDAIGATVKAGGADAGRAKAIAKNAWKQDAAADRRTRSLEILPKSQWRSPYRGQPEHYNAEVVRAFMHAITQAAGRATFERGNRNGGIMLDVLVAAVQWAIFNSWQMSAPPGVLAPRPVKRTGILRIVREAKMHEHRQG